MLGFLLLGRDLGLGYERLLHNNKMMAERRLLQTEKRLSKDKQVEEAYKKTIEQYISKGYVEKLNQTTSSSQDPDNTEWYLPHFPVIRPDRATTKVRIVFDAAAKFDGLSLNDTIMTGPKLQRELFTVLLRFRRGAIAIACDLKEMYLQVAVREEDRNRFGFFGEI